MGTEIGSALIELGEDYGQNTFIGIYAINSVEVRNCFIFVVHRCIRFLRSSG